MATAIATNEYGITRYATWDDLCKHQDLRTQLQAAGVCYAEIQIPYIAGMGGNAVLILYTSPKTSQPITVLCIPHRPEIDSFAEEYWYCEGMAAEQAVEIDWGKVYEFTREIAR